MTTTQKLHRENQIKNTRFFLPSDYFFLAAAEEGSKRARCAPKHAITAMEGTATKTTAGCSFSAIQPTKAEIDPMPMAATAAGIRA